jgi:hypothetical protein
MSAALCQGTVSTSAEPQNPAFGCSNLLSWDVAINPNIAPAGTPRPVVENSIRPFGLRYVRLTGKAAQSLQSP